MNRYLSTISKSVKSAPSFNGSKTDPNLEKLVDRKWTKNRSLLVDGHLVYRDAENLGGGHHA